MSSSMPPGGEGTGQPEYLEQGSGSPLAADSSASSARGGKRRALLVGGGLAALALIGVGSWAAVSFFATGAQPAEALPDSTLGYVSVDLDPSGSQKLDAMRMLKKFPSIDEQIDLDTDDDLKERLFEEMGLEESCAGVTYADDVEPWLGDRAAVAMIDLGEDASTPVAAIQLSDAAAAKDGLAVLQECAGGDEGGWAISGDWVVVAETTSIADRVVEETESGSLSEDADYQKWTDEVGDSGILNMYAAPEAGAYLADSMDGMFGLGGLGGTAELTEALEDFAGMAMTVRFDDGGVELAFASDASPMGKAAPTSDAGGDVIATLPEDTAVALGLGLTEGWFGDVLDQLAGYSGGMSVEDLIEEAQQETGLELPEDAETLTGESAALALGGGFDPEALVNSASGSDVPFGIKVKGDAEAIETVLDKLRATVPAGELDISSDSDGDMVAFGPNADYVDEILGDGSLGDLDAYQDVVAESDNAGAVLFVNFNASSWLDSFLDSDPELARNLEPLAALGMSGWIDGDVSHAVLRLSTD